MVEGPAGPRDLGHEKGQCHILGPYDWRTTEEKRSPKQPDHDIAGGRQSQKENELSGDGTIQRRWGSGLGHGQKDSSVLAELEGVWTWVSIKAGFQVDQSACHPQVPRKAFSGHLLLSLPLGMELLSKAAGAYFSAVLVCVGALWTPCSL